MGICSFSYKGMMPIDRCYESKLAVKLPKKISWEVNHGVILCAAGCCILLFPAEENTLEPGTEPFIFQ